MKMAFTLLELLVVIAIMVALAAVLFPVFSQTKRHAYMTQTISNLHHVGLGLSLYRADWGGEGVYGDSFSMGMPANAIRLEPYGVSRNLEFWPAGEQVRERRVLYRRYPTPKEESSGRPYTWTQYVTKNGDAAVSFASMSYTDEGQPLRSIFGTYLGLGVRLDMSVVKRIRAGNWDDYAWWE